MCDGENKSEVGGSPIARNAALAGLGMDMAITNNATLSLDYNGQYGGGNREHTGTLHLSWRY